jgi:tetratricopeptide (TPR) repeat protein
MNKKINNNFTALYILCAAFCAAFAFAFLISCSTSPKNPEDVDVLRLQGEQWLKSGNSLAGQGSFETALTILTETKRNAILTDDLSLIIRVCLSRGNVFFSLGRTNEAFEEWNQAVTEAQLLGDRELLAVSKIYLARGNLISGRSAPQTVLDEVVRESANIRTNRLFIAFSWQVRGLALRSMGSYSEAEEAFRRSLAIHERDKHLENASYDWFTIASIRSRSGNIQGALQALETSINIDRRIENSWGIAASYRAMGDVYQNDGRRQEAITAYNRARAIYAAMRNDHEVAETDKRINSRQ